MSNDAFDQIEQARCSSGPQAVFGFLEQKFREEKKYPQLFEARLMKKRYELGLPLIQVEPSGDCPLEKRRAYEEEFIQAAREIGSLFLAEGDFEHAWPYFRAIGEVAPVASALDQLDPAQWTDQTIAIAFYERVNPRKGFEMILSRYGICRAISSFIEFPDRNGRDESLRLLIRTLHGEVVKNLKRTIAQQEGNGPDTESIPALIEDRDWLFEGNSYYVDTTHLVSILRYSPDLNDRESLALMLELTEYGTHLGPMFQFPGEPPFENIFQDYGIYLGALLGKNVDEAVAHFRKKVAESNPERAGSIPAQILVGLLVRLGRYPEAIEAWVQYLRNVDPAQLTVPTLPQLCQLAGAHEQNMEFAREQGDLLSFAAAALQK